MDLTYDGLVNMYIILFLINSTHNFSTVSRTYMVFEKQITRYAEKISVAFLDSVQQMLTMITIDTNVDIAIIIYLFISKRFFDIDKFINKIFNFRIL